MEKVFLESFLFFSLPQGVLHIF